MPCVRIWAVAYADRRSSSVCDAWHRWGGVCGLEHYMCWTSTCQFSPTLCHITRWSLLLRVSYNSLIFSTFPVYASLLENTGSAFAIRGLNPHAVLLLRPDWLVVTAGNFSVVRDRQRMAGLSSTEWISNARRVVVFWATRKLPSALWRPARRIHRILYLLRSSKVKQRNTGRPGWNRDGSVELMNSAWSPKAAMANTKKNTLESVSLKAGSYSHLNIQKTKKNWFIVRHIICRHKNVYNKQPNNKTILTEILYWIDIYYEYYYEEKFWLFFYFVFSAAMWDGAAEFLTRNDNVAPCNRRKTYPFGGFPTFWSVCEVNFATVGHLNHFS